MRTTPLSYIQTLKTFEDAIDDDNKVIYELRKSVRNAEISLDARKLALRRAEARLADRVDRYRAFQAGQLKSFDIDAAEALSNEMAKGYEP